jgi:putative hydrolase
MVMHPQNQKIGQQLADIAQLLKQQGASRFRFEAYEKAGATLRELDSPVADLVSAGGTEALVALPHIGDGIASVIEDIVQHGQSRVLERLRDGDDVEKLLQTLPGIGPRLARRLHVEIGIESLEELEQTCIDGRLLAQPGFGKKRIEALQAVLGRRLGRRPAPGQVVPPVALLLEIDQLYRSGVEEGRFRKIAPRRFNPEGKAWLPIAHLHLGAWHFTALFSNTAMAHKLSRTRDWVIVYFYDGNHREDQCTIVTERRGPLAGRRVVRGREKECQNYYDTSRSAQAKSGGARSSQTSPTTQPNQPPTAGGRP